MIQLKKHGQRAVGNIPAIIVGAQHAPRFHDVPVTFKPRSHKPRLSAMQIQEIRAWDAEKHRIWQMYVR